MHTHVTHDSQIQTIKPHRALIFSKIFGIFISHSLLDTQCTHINKIRYTTSPTHTSTQNTNNRVQITYYNITLTCGNHWHYKEF